MLKKVINFTNFDGEACSEVVYFNLTKAELLEMEVGIEGGMAQMLKELIEAEKGKDIIAFFKQIIISAYGVRSENGRRFIKSLELSEEFVQTAAYSELFMELALDAKKAAEFVRGIMPEDLLAGATQDLSLAGLDESAGKTILARTATPSLQHLSIEELRALIEKGQSPDA